MRRSLSALLALLAFSVPAAAQSSYPEHPVTMVVPFAAGGPLDIVARHIAEAMSRTLEKNVLVENIGGAGGTLGAARVAKAKPDGYTLLMYHIGLATSPALYKGRLGFNPIDDFRPIGLVNEVAMALVVRPDLGIDSLPSFVQRLATEPETIKIGHAGIGSASHLCTLLIGVATKNDRLIAVSYRGTGPAMTDLLGGHIDVICDLITSSSSVIASKRVNVLAVTTSARLPSLPSVPTVAEVGLGKLEMTNWNALLVPANTPDAIAEKLSAALRSALEDPKVIENLSKLGTAPVRQEDATPDALKQRIAAEIARWSPIIEGAGASGQP